MTRLIQIEGPVTGRVLASWANVAWEWTLALGAFDYGVEALLGERPPGTYETEDGTITIEIDDESVFARLDEPIDSGLLFRLKLHPFLGHSQSTEHWAAID